MQEVVERPGGNLDIETRCTQENVERQRGSGNQIKSNEFRIQEVAEGHRGGSLDIEAR